MLVQIGDTAVSAADIKKVRAIIIEDRSGAFVTVDTRDGSYFQESFPSLRDAQEAKDMLVFQVNEVLRGVF